MRQPISATNPDNNSAELSTRVLQLIQALIEEINPRQASLKRVTLDDRLDKDLGVDSLARIELLGRIERQFKVNLPESTFASAETPRDLLRSVLGATDRQEPAKLPEWNTADLAESETEATPESAQTLIEVLNWHVAKHPNRPHIRFYSETDHAEVISYAQLKQDALAVAAGLQHRGLQAAETVTLMLPTGKDYFISFYGILFAGGIPVPIYPPMRLSQLEDHLRRQTGILNNCRSVLLITVLEAKPLGHLLKSQVETLRSVATTQELITAAQDKARLTPPIGARDIALLQYTSGSTGNPKGVILSHANLLANIRADGRAIQVSASDVFVSWLPLYHDMGLIGAWLGSLYFAVPLVIMSPLTFLAHPQHWLWALHRYRATLSAAPNFAYELCLNTLDTGSLSGLDLSHWRIAFNGAEAVNPDTVERFCERFAPYGFRAQTMFPVYGLAECSLGLSFPPLNRSPQIDCLQRKALMRTGQAVPATNTDEEILRFISCGYPLPGHQIRVVDETGRELPERHQGRLEFRGPSATSGYFRASEATQALFHGDWLDSGDLAYIAAGEIYLTGRIKDVIIRAGRNIYPHELEQAVGDIDGIRKGRVVVFGSTDPQSGTERLVVLAETQATEAATLSEIRSQINAITTDLIWSPADDVVLAPPNTILKTSSGKVRRAACREVYERGLAGQTPSSLWWQLTRLAFSGLLPSLRRLGNQIKRVLYGSYAWILFLMIACLVFVAVMCLPKDSWRWWTMRKAIRFLTITLGIGIRVNGLGHLPPQHQAGVYVANHASYLDVFVIIANLPREFSFIAKAELKDNPLIHTFLRRIRTEFVARGDKDQALLDARRSIEIAQRGRSLFFFPEGTFTRMPGVLPFRMGAFTAAVEAKLPIIPVAIRGTRSILRADTSLPRRGSLSITIGEPVMPHAFGDSQQDPWQTAIGLRNAAREHILDHSGEPDLAHEQVRV